MGLLPLTVIDYNCMDRAALKLKIIIDCLYPRRQLNGTTLVPREVREAYIDDQWTKRKLRNIKLLSKLLDFSVQLKIALGQHVVYAKQYNEQALQIEQSVKKVNDFKMANQLKGIKTYKEHFPDSSSALSKLVGIGKTVHQKAHEEWEARDITGDSRNEQAMVMTLELS